MKIVKRGQPTNGDTKYLEYTFIVKDEFSRYYTESTVDNLVPADFLEGRFTDHLHNNWEPAFRVELVDSLTGEKLFLREDFFIDGKLVEDQEVIRKLKHTNGMFDAFQELLDEDES